MSLADFLKDSVRFSGDCYDSTSKATGTRRSSTDQHATVQKTLVGARGRNAAFASNSNVALNATVRTFVQIGAETG
jgi:hypothetical protein